MLRYNLITASRRRNAVIGLSQATAECAIGEAGVLVVVRGQSSAQQPQVDEESPIIVPAPSTTTQTTTNTPQSGTSIPWRERMASLREASNKVSHSPSRSNSKTNLDPLSTFFQKRAELLSQSSERKLEGPQSQPETKARTASSGGTGADLSQWRIRLQQSSQKLQQSNNNNPTIGNDNNNRNRPPFVPRTTRPTFQPWNPRAAIVTTPDPNESIRSALSISDKIKNPEKEEEDATFSDMKDVSRLRAAMLRALDQKKRQGPPPGSPDGGLHDSMMRSSWRTVPPSDDHNVRLSGGAREWRTRLKQQTREQQLQLKYEQRQSYQQHQQRQPYQQHQPYPQHQRQQQQRQPYQQHQPYPQHQRQQQHHQPQHHHQQEQEQQQEEHRERKGERRRQGQERPERPNLGAFFADKAKGPPAQTRQSERRHEERFRHERDINDKKVTLPPNKVSVSDLSAIFRIKVNVIMKTLRESGEFPRDEHHVVDIDTMEVVALDLGLEPTRSSRRAPKSLSEENRELLLQRRADDETYDLNRAAAEAHATMPLRPPVVCLMGHVDHGKTTLMDALRRRRKRGVTVTSGKKKKMKNKGEASKNVSDGVAGTEAGGITQAISAFQVPLEDEENGAVTFLDTPGHAAFRSMRESGSHAADVIVLVVAADDGVSPQTIEIINFFKSIYKETGGISLVVAMTKIDKPGIIVDESRYRIENELMEQGIVPESFASTTKGEYGPPVQIVPVSGLTGEGVDNLIEALVLQSEVMELRADPDAQAEGIILDARFEKGVGVVADCIIRWGSMKRGDVVLSGLHTGKVKALKDTSGGVAKKVLPSEPVRILGFKTLPKAGDPVVCVDSEEKAEKLIQRRAALGGVEGSVRTEDDGPSSLEIMGVAAQHRKLQVIHDKYNIDMHAVGSTIRIPVVLRADADGTLAALCDAIVAIGNESSLDMVIDPIGLGIGPISAADVKLAKDSNAPIFSFNVKQNDKEALALLEENGVVMKSSKVIYTILDAAKEVFASYIPQTSVAHVHGKAVVKAIFEVNNSSERDRIAGLRVTEGHLFREKASLEGKPFVCHYRVIRNGEQISPKGEVISASSMRKVKEDVQEVRNGEECGLGLNGFKDFEEGDIIECYSVEMKTVVL